MINNSFKICKEKIEGQGEDAEPTLFSTKINSHVIAVYDGMGGAGSAIYEYQDQKCSGAKIASNHIKLLLEEFFFENPPSVDEFLILLESLERKIKHEFKDLINKIEIKPSRIKSKLIKRLPTTLAGLYFYKQPEKDDESIIKIICFWAGDSRCYLLYPQKGLLQLSKDDLVSGADAFINLNNDSPISNCINADNEFKINNYMLSVPLPVILFTATDGCFGYVNSPAHFEWLLLSSLNDSNTIDEWKENLDKSIGEIAQDDYSLSLIMEGWDSFEKIKEDFFDRSNKLKNEYINPYNEIINEKNEQMQDGCGEEKQIKDEQIKTQLWEKYKVNYEEYLKKSYEKG